MCFVWFVLTRPSAFHTFPPKLNPLTQEFQQCLEHVVLIVILHLEEAFCYHYIFLMLFAILLEFLCIEIVPQTLVKYVYDHCKFGQ